MIFPVISFDHFTYDLYNQTQAHEAADTAEVREERQAPSRPLRLLHDTHTRKKSLAIMPGSRVAPRHNNRPYIINLIIYFGVEKRSFSFLFIVWKEH